MRGVCRHTTLFEANKVGTRHPSRVLWGSRCWVEEAPGDGPDFVEEANCHCSSLVVDRVCSGEETKMGVDFFG